VSVRGAGCGVNRARLIPQAQRLSTTGWRADHLTANWSFSRPAERHGQSTRDMKASTLYRVAAVCLLLFAVAHTVGFQQSDPAWGIDALRGSMRSIHFDVQGVNRTYWHFFVGAGLTVGVLYLVMAILAWQLSVVPVATLAQMRVLVWTFAVGFAAIAM
jgi:hypothetical protein